MCIAYVCISVAHDIGGRIGGTLAEEPHLLVFHMTLTTVIICSFESQEIDCNRLMCVCMSKRKRYDSFAPRQFKQLLHRLALILIYIPLTYNLLLLLLYD